MLSNPNPESDATPRRGMRYYMVGSAIVLLLAICYVGWVFFSRWQQNRAIAEKAEKQPPQNAPKTSRLFKPWAATTSKFLVFTPIPRPSVAVIRPRSVTAYPTPKASPLIRPRTCASGHPTSAASASRPPKPPPTPSPPATPPPTPSPPKPPSKSTEARCRCHAPLPRGSLTVGIVITSEVSRAFAFAFALAVVAAASPFRRPPLPLPSPL